MIQFRSNSIDEPSLLQTTLGFFSLGNLIYLKKRTHCAQFWCKRTPSSAIPKRERMTIEHNPAQKQCTETSDFTRSQFGKITRNHSIAHPDYQQSPPSLCCVIPSCLISLALLAVWETATAAGCWRALVFSAIMPLVMCWCHSIENWNTNCGVRFFSHGKGQVTLLF